MAKNPSLTKRITVILAEDCHVHTGKGCKVCTEQDQLACWGYLARKIARETKKKQYTKGGLLIQ